MEFINQNQSTDKLVNKTFKLIDLQKTYKDQTFIFDKDFPVKTNYCIGSSFFTYKKVITELKSSLSISKENLGFHLNLGYVTNDHLITILPKDTPKDLDDFLYNQIKDLQKKVDNLEKIIYELHEVKYQSKYTTVADIKGHGRIIYNAGF